MAFPGVICVWSGNGPRFETYRIPPHADGLVLGREIANAADDRISRTHARLTIGDDDAVTIVDLESRNGTYVEGVRLHAPTRTSTTIVRTGRSVFVVVPEIRPYEHVPISRRGSLVIGGTLDQTCRAVDTAAVEAENLVLVGARSVGFELARSYANALGGQTAVFDASMMAFPLETLITQKPALRTVVLELGTQRLGGRDVATILELMETDVRFVTRVKSETDLAGLPPAIAPRLRSRVVELPKARLDELPTTISDIVAELAPATTIHVSVIERSLLMTRNFDEDRLLESLRADVRRWALYADRTRGLRAEHLFEPDEYPAHWCMHHMRPRR